MELFDIKYVYMDWDDVLKGKKVLVGDILKILRNNINGMSLAATCVEPNGGSKSLYPFEDSSGTAWALAYYDPNYECKVAYKQGKVIQFRYHGTSDEAWAYCTGVPKWLDACEYRVKPEKWRSFKDIQELKNTWYRRVVDCEPIDFIEPMIWVRSKSNTTSTYLITHYCENMGVVHLCGYLNVGLEQLFEDYEFLDGTPCGVEG